MQVLASPRAAEFIRQRGGRLFVWTDRTECAVGTLYVEASLDAPPDTEGFRRFESEAFELHLRPVGDSIPYELHIDLAGRWRPRIRAYWNGGAFVP